VQRRPPKHRLARNALTSRYMGAVPITFREPNGFRGVRQPRHADQVLPQEEYVENVPDWRGFGRSQEETSRGARVCGRCA
jgi:hypothetical protein